MYSCKFVENFVVHLLYVHTMVINSLQIEYPSVTGNKLYTIVMTGVTS